MGRYNKFWLSLAGPLATGLTMVGLDAGVAQTIATSVAGLAGSLFVIFGPANR